METKNRNFCLTAARIKAIIPEEEKDLKKEIEYLMNKSIYATEEEEEISSGEIKIKTEPIKKYWNLLRNLICNRPFTKEWEEKAYKILCP